MGRGPSIESRKNASDARRGKIFTKLIREIGVAARAGGVEPQNNPRLRAAMDKALSFNMSKEVMDRAIKKAAGALEGSEYEEVRYEGYAPGGVAVLVDCLTDNRVRTVADVRYAFSKCGGNLGTENSVGFLFNRCGVVHFVGGAQESAITDVAITSGAEDVVVYQEDGAIDVLTSPEHLPAVQQAMLDAGMSPAHAEVTLRAKTYVSVDDQTGQAVRKLLEMLDDLDDVQNVYTNIDASSWEDVTP